MVCVLKDLKIKCDKKVKYMLSRKVSIDSNKTTSAVDKTCKVISERRRVIEQARAVNVRRIQQEVQRIAQREIDFTQRLLSEYSPVKLSFNQDAWNRLQDFMPIRVDFGQEEEAKTTPSARSVEDAPSGDIPEAPSA